MNNLKDMFEMLIDSTIERAKVRPFWEQKTKLVNAYVFWKKLNIENIKNHDFEIQEHKIYPSLNRLVYLPNKKLIGYGLDKEFLIQELYELYSKKDGFVDLTRTIKRIAHISDLHISWKSKKTKDGSIIDPNFLDKIAKSLKKENPDLIVVTGDITDDGLGYIKFYNAFKEFITEGKLIVVPGNHDVNPLGTSVLASGFKIADYEEFARIIMGKREYINDFIFEFKNLTVLAANSSAGFNKNIIDNAVGYVDLKSLGSRRKKLNKANKKIFLMHHHLESINSSILEKISPEIQEFIDGFMKLENGKEVSGFCDKSNIDLLLHGHKHISYKKRSKQVSNMQIFGSPSVAISGNYHIISDGDKGFIRKEVFI